MHIWRHIENYGNHFLIIETDFDLIPKVNKLFYECDLGRFPSINGVNHIDIHRHMLQFKISSMFLDRLQEIKDSIETKLEIPSSDITYGFYKSNLEKILAMQEPQIASKEEKIDLPTMTDDDKKQYQENIRKFKLRNRNKIVIKKEKKMIEYKFEIPFGDEPNANGRIYPKELVKKMVKEMNNKQFPITTEKTEFDANKPFDDKEIIGVTTSAVHHDDNKVVVQCQIIDGNIHEHLKMGVSVVPNGVGSLKETGEVTDYQLKFFSITGNSAFKKEIK